MAKGVQGTLTRERLVVVVVEDDPMQQDIYRVQLARMALPIESAIAMDGDEGMRAIRRLKPDLVIADLNMPGMDGFQMIREIEQDPDLSHTRIVSVTGLDWPEISDHGGLPANVLVYEKPVPFAEIEALLRTCV
jgi:CheY-like chemotaxis protein